MSHDLIVRGGTVIDGTGGPARRLDVAISDGVIEEMAPSISGRPAEEIDARGAIVTPGFIDIHTHYDGQATWDDQLLPSSAHGVTTALMGTCGIGFAPVRSGAEDWLIRITEGVEDIPGTALHLGIDWRWESIPDYLDVLAQRQFSIDLGVHVPHSAVRAYVMGHRVEADEDASDDELDAMARIVEDAVRAGAVGVGTSRTASHRGSDGTPLPGTRAAERELMVLGNALRRAGGGVMQMVPSGAAGGAEGTGTEPLRVGLTRRDRWTLSAELEMIRRLHLECGQPVTFTFAENRGLGHDEFARARERLSGFAAEGLRIHPQIAPRPVGGLVSLDTYHPFLARPAYVEIAGLPRSERVRRMENPDTRRAIVFGEDLNTASDDPRQNTYATLQRNLDYVYRLRDADYEPDPETSVTAVARATGREPLEVVYDWLLEDDGRAVLVWCATSYLGGDLSTVRELLEDPLTVVGLGDGGAHVKFICDASFPTFLLAHWARDRTRGPLLSMEHVVHKLTGAQADLYGLHDRGVVEEGRRADLNVIDPDRVALRSPRLVADLPGGAQRFVQDSVGYRATMVAGQVARRDDEDTGTRAGRLVRRHAAR